MKIKIIVLGNVFDKNIEDGDRLEKVLTEDLRRAIHSGTLVANDRFGVPVGEMYCPSEEDTITIGFPVTPIKPEVEYHTKTVVNRFGELSTINEYRFLREYFFEKGLSLWDHHLAEARNLVKTSPIKRKPEHLLLPLQRFSLLQSTYESVARSGQMLFTKGTWPYASTKGDLNGYDIEPPGKLFVPALHSQLKKMGIEVDPQPFDFSRFPSILNGVDPENIPWANRVEAFRKGYYHTMEDQFELSTVRQTGINIIPLWNFNRLAVIYDVECIHSKDIEKIYSIDALSAFNIDVYVAHGTAEHDILLNHIQPKQIHNQNASIDNTLKKILIPRVVSTPEGYLIENQNKFSIAITDVFTVMDFIGSFKRKNIGTTSEIVSQSDKDNEAISVEIKHHITSRQTIEMKFRVRFVNIHRNGRENVIAGLPYRKGDTRWRRVLEDTLREKDFSVALNNFQQSSFFKQEMYGISIAA